MNPLKNDVDGTTKPSAARALRVKVGPERIVLGDGLQPFMFQTKKGTLFLQAQTSPTPGFRIAATNPIPGYTTVCETAPGYLFVCYDIGSWGGQAVRYVAGREVEISRS